MFDEEFVNRKKKQRQWGGGGNGRCGVANFPSRCSENSAINFRLVDQISARQINE